MLIPVIMAGGSGTRFAGLFPVGYIQNSFLRYKILTMLQNTILRLDDINCLQPLVISNESHRFLVAEQLRELNLLSGNIILEPVGKKIRHRRLHWLLFRH